MDGRLLPAGAAAAASGDANDAATRGAQVLALREHFGLLFGVAAALGMFSAARFYTVSWLGERITTDVRRTRSRAALVAFVIIATSAALLWGLYQGTQAVLDGLMTAGELRQTVLYVILPASSAAVLGEVWGDLLRAAGATERLMEPLYHPVDIVSKETVRHYSVNRSGLAIDLENVRFHYPSRPGTSAHCDRARHPQERALAAAR